MISNEKPKTITQLSKEQLEDMCLNLMHIDNEKANIIENLEQQNTKLKERINYLEQSFIELYEENQKLFNHLTVEKILKGEQKNEN